jgi:hypothetical protein
MNIDDNVNTSIIITSTSSGDDGRCCQSVLSVFTVTLFDLYIHCTKITNEAIYGKTKLIPIFFW